ncbi:sulfite reductase alpha subunit-like flavoprotein [Microbacteriaceae bacterium SG_E_30_P1]|uniref:Sulfite reductase alpha subunit-like flavoprotein n=1 Tax=Antiquaquibacter oligotrophicus TaxID=2880260 RepID=A0ABT6KNJ8_9MICO|nr:flavodoxin domain-containing protein [Antiquaquibacter oligotrophicus]MDH6180744.1 sulfite reductase alpha subunit-like flavoprotein [Antiquaquibacter oligotrophicus]UDF13531.1 flavodoxin domain-containing protein [Antiquaquibacter oligotrophicus]
MRTVIVYESQFGNTRQVADAIAEGARQVSEVRMVNVNDATPERLDSADLVLVGGPTHVHGMSRPETRAQAQRIADADDNLILEPQAPGTGIREWLESGPVLPALVAAFDTRADAAKWLTGSAARHIAKRLRGHGRTMVIEPGSFLAPDNDIDLSEVERARDWGARAARSAIETTGLDYARRTI